MMIFDGKGEAEKRKQGLLKRLEVLPKAKIFSLVFDEDEPSKIYTRLKKKDAASIGIEYEDVYVPILTPTSDLLSYILSANQRDDVSGIIIQKPVQSLMPSSEWWNMLTDAIDPRKDVDGLISEKSGVIPATARAIVTIAEIATGELEISLQGKTAVVLGRSDIVGKPAALELQKRGMNVHLFGRQEFATQQSQLKEADLVVAATGKSDLVVSSMLKTGVIAIDAGSPAPEINPENLDKVASFLSPVPGGVGPMTRICLLENLVDLVESSR